MVTIVNNPPASNNSGSSLGIIVLIIVGLLIGYVGYVYGLPAVQKMQKGDTQIVVPDKIDINVKQQGS